MSHDLIVDRVEKIRVKRKALFDRGNIKLVSISGKRGRMIAIDPNNVIGVAEASEYNRLAEKHRKMKL